MDATSVIAIVCAALAALSVVAGPLLGRWAADKTAVAALNTAEAQMRSAVVAERAAASADWESHTVALQRYADSMADRLGRVEQRLDDAEMRNIATELRATKAEGLYAVALIYLRRIALWVNDHLPGATLPPPPPELENDLDLPHGITEE